MILLVSLGFLATYPIGAENLVHTPHELFLCIIRPNIDHNSMLAEAVLNNLGNIKSGLR